MNWGGGRKRPEKGVWKGLEKGVAKGMGVKKGMNGSRGGPHSLRKARGQKTRPPRRLSDAPAQAHRAVGVDDRGGEPDRPAASRRIAPSRPRVAVRLRVAHLTNGNRGKGSS